MSNKLALTPEIGATLLSKTVTDSQSATLKSNPVDFVKSNYDIDVTSEVKVIENSADTINIVLPYYSGLETASANAVTDSKMDSVAGGEVIFSVIVCASILGASSVAIGGVAIASTQTDITKTK